MLLLTAIETIPIISLMTTKYNGEEYCYDSGLTGNSLHGVRKPLFINFFLIFS